jgi:hypothetical protein
LAGWLEEPSTYSATILNKFSFLIDGKAKKDIETFIKKKPKERHREIVLLGTNIQHAFVKKIYFNVSYYILILILNGCGKYCWPDVQPLLYT